MIDAEIRIRCIEAAAAVPGNPNTLQLAKEFYAFALEGSTPAEAPLETEEAPSASQQLRVTKKPVARK